MSNSVNRSLIDEDMDRIDHALGRPVAPLIESYRNYFAIGEFSTIAKGFDASPNWVKGKSCGDMAYFFVTDCGRKALNEYLKNIGDKNREFIIHYKGMELKTISTSHSKARYKKWLDIYDCDHDLKFIEFCRYSKVKVAKQLSDSEVK